MWASDLNAGVEDHVFREPIEFASWLERWVDGRLHQPALIEDAVTGEVAELVSVPKRAPRSLSQSSLLIAY